VTVFKLTLLTSLESNDWQDEFMSDDEEDQTHDSYWSDTSSISYEEGVCLTGKKTLNELRKELGIPVEIEVPSPKTRKGPPQKSSHSSSKSVESHDSQEIEAFSPE
jgi:hypothetical protein